MAKDRLTKDELIQLILAMADDVVAAKDQLTELDSVIGDGDLGVTMTLGFNEVKNKLSNPSALRLEQVLKNAGMAFADKAASTFGTLVSTMFMKAGEAMKGKDTRSASRL